MLPQGLIEASFVERFVNVTFAADETVEHQPVAPEELLDQLAVEGRIPLVNLVPFNLVRIAMLGP